MPKELQDAIRRRIDESITPEAAIEWNLSELMNHLGGIVEIPQDPEILAALAEELSFALRDAQTRLDVAAFAWQAELQRTIDSFEHAGEFIEIGPQDAVPLPPSSTGKYVSHIRSSPGGDRKQVFHLTEDAAPRLFDRSEERKIVAELLAESIGIVKTLAGDA